MKAVYILEQGGPEVLLYGDWPDPVIGPDEVLVRVRAAALNRLDLYSRSGEKGVRIATPRILGLDFAGEVAEVGAAAQNRLQPGDRVLVDPNVSCGRCDACLLGHDEDCPDRVSLGITADGGYAELAKAPARNAHKIPEALSFEEAAALPIAFKTAWRMMVGRARVQPGETVLVHAAGSGVGSAAIQIARLFGCRIFATAGADWKLERARELGADEAVNYTEETWPDLVRALTEDRGVDIVIDSVGASLWEGSFSCLARGGRLVTCGVTSGHRVSLHLGRLFTEGQSILGVGGLPNSDFPTIMKLVQRGLFKGIVHAVLPLEQAQEAHRLLESRNVFGKIILKV
ncbi:MAG: zinc-binding dehydrogenase [Chloroflexi bacterium]|nr:zinc-binding dehydrogenase [Chloroflexota bacterium]